MQKEGQGCGAFQAEHRAPGPAVAADPHLAAVLVLHDSLCAGYPTARSHTVTVFYECYLWNTNLSPYHRILELVEWGTAWRQCIAAGAGCVSSASDDVMDPSIESLFLQLRVRMLLCMYVVLAGHAQTAASNT